MKRMSIYIIILLLLFGVGCTTGLSGKTKPNPSYIDSTLRTFSTEEAKTIIANFHKDPNQYYQAMTDVLFYQLKQENPLLAKELGKLPEFEDGSSPSETEALEDIVSLYRLDKDNFDEAFQQMYQVGIPEVRQYCTPLAVLFNLAMSGEFNENNNPIENYNLYDFIRIGWGYEGPKDSFEEVTSMLNSPELIDIYEKLYFRYIHDTRDVAQHPKETFEKKGGDCEDFALFTSCCLEKGGYKTWALMSWWDYGEMGHNVATYKENGKMYVLDNGRYSPKGIIGPFKSQVEIGRTIAKYSGVSPNTIKRIWAYNWRTFLSNYGNFPFRESLI